MADNVSEQSRVSQSEISEKSNRWAFLKRFLKHKFSKPIQSPEQTQVNTAIQAETSQQKMVMPTNSGLEKVVKIMEQGQQRLTAERIRKLYPDFVKYLNEDLKNKFSKDPQTLAKIAAKLEAGNPEVIEMFARVLAEKYSGDITQRRRAQVESQKQIPTIPGSEAELLGLKKREAEVLAFEMQNKIKQEEKRESRADIASIHGEWKTVLVEPKKSPIDQIDWDKELSNIASNSAVSSPPAQPVSSAPQK